VVDETSYYGALEHFFDEIGKTLKPKVLPLKNRGAGPLDIGLFTKDQVKTAGRTQRPTANAGAWHY